MDTLLQRLKLKERRGSKPRCHLLSQGPAERVAERLSNLIKPWGQVSARDAWMPAGFDDIDEAELHNAPRLLDSSIGRELRRWWLAVDTPNSKTPNFDIASSCTVLVGGEAKSGLLLIEAKAHKQELRKEE